MKDQGKTIIDGNNDLTLDWRLKSHAIEESINAIAFARIDGAIFYANKSFLKLWRVTDTGEIIGKPAFGLFKSPLEAQEIAQRVIERGEWEGEITAIRHDQSEFIVKFSAKVLADGDSPITLMASFVDITELKKTETALKQRESLLETKNVELKEIIDALDHSSLVSITDLKGTILKVNNRFCKVARYEEHELLGRNHSIISSGYHGKGFWKNFWNTISQGEVWRGEIKNKAKDGSEYWVDTVINPIRNEDGRVTHFLSIRQDITDRKKYESLLLQSNLRLGQIEQFVDLTMDTITVADERGSLIYINKAASERLGIPQEVCTDFNVNDFEILFKERGNWSGFVERLKKIDSINGERVYVNKKTGKNFAVDVTARYVVIQGKGCAIAVARDISERKKGEVELSESRERLAEAQRIAKLGYWEQNFVTNSIWWSDMQYEIFGIKKSELPTTNDDFIKLIHPEDRSKFIKILNGKLSDSVEHYRIINPDGKERVVHAVAQITYNELGVPIKLSGVNQDITDRIKVENALRESERTLRKAQEIAKIGSWKLDIVKDILQWSDETYRIFDVPPTKRPLTNADFYSHVHPEDKDYVIQAWKDAVEGKIPKYEVIHRIIAGDTIKWVAEQNEFSYDFDTPIEAIGTVQDITAQMFLRDTNVIFNQSQSLAGIGSWRWSIKSGELFLSDSFFALFGIDKNVTPTREIYLNSIYHEDRDRFNSINEEVHKHHQPFEVQYRIQMPTGELKWIHEKGNVLVDHRGDVVEMYGIVREITSEKNKTEELEAARKEAEEAASIKDEFLSVMSHEIRTPLNSVIGLSNLLLRRSPREDQMAIMKTLKGSADNLLHLVNDILDYNKIRAGKLELETISFSLNKFLQHLHSSYSLAAQEKGLDFTIQEDPRIPDMLMGDVGRLNQIFNNLLNNALKFTSQGYVKLIVELKSSSIDACTILFKVKDTGVGIAADKMDSIFIPFQQSEKSISRKFGGTGLGLSIVKTLVEIMGGVLSLRSEEGVGSVFSLEFDFPFSVIEESKILPEPRETISLNGKSRTKKLEVLYVEDVESNRFLIKNLLVDYQISCQTASSGQAALRLTKKKKFDIILMDIQMPKMDGYQATEKIRKQTGGKNCKTNILAFTAEPYSEVLKTRIAKHNIQDVITKPFNTDNLIDKINSLTEPAASFFSFSFYERAFNNDRKKLRSIKKTVIKDVKHLESNLLKYHKTGNLKGIRSEIHKMRPIMKNLECLPLYEIMDKYKWPDEYTREAASTNREILKLVKRLLSKIERLKY